MTASQAVGSSVIKDRRIVVVGNRIGVVAAGLVFGVFCMLAVATMSAVLTSSSIATSRRVFSTLSKQTRFERKFAIYASGFRLNNFAMGYSEEPEQYEDDVYRFISKERRRFDILAEHYKRKKSQSPALRDANRAFKQFQTSFEAYISFQHWAIETSRTVRVANHTFDEFAEAYFDTIKPIGKEARQELDDNSAKFAERLHFVSTNASHRTLILANMVQTVLFVAIAWLCWTLVKICKDADSKLEALDRLVRQQAHENRSKYAPAMYCMDQFVEMASREDCRVESLVALCDDMSLALLALKEVEAQHQARLDMYKVMRGNYVPHYETFDVLSFMRERVSVERAIAAARRGGTDACDVDYVVKVDDTTYADCEALYVRTDLYVLNHVISNCLSNSRKFTYSGRIVLTFCGLLDRRLVFRVADTGTGIHPHVIDNLFCKDVATGDTRGTGLGMPSVHLFCKAVGGYIKLIETRQQDENGRNGYTCFEFALTGAVVRGDRPSTPPSVDARECLVPSPAESARESHIYDDVAVIVVDDSALHRSCVVRALKRVQNDTEAQNWSYSQFETIEAAQPFLVQIHQTGKRSIVCLDEQMGSKGGILTGIQGTRWLINELGFRGIIISTSGDPDAGLLHLSAGAHGNWGKPLPAHSRILGDILAAFSGTAA